MGRSYIGDIGTKIQTTLNTSLSDLSSATYYIKKPNGDTTTWACSVESTTTGIVYYNTASGDFNVAGKYILHVRLVFNDGSQYTSDVENFNVYSLYQY